MSGGDRGRFVLALAGAALAGFFAGALVGLPAGPERSRPAGSPAAGAAGAARGEPRLPGPGGRLAGGGSSGPELLVRARPSQPPGPAAGGAPDGGAAAAEADPEHQDAQEPSHLGEALDPQALAGLDLEALLRVVREAGAEASGLVTEALLRNPSLLEQALERLRAGGAAEELDALAAVLGQLHTPEIEAAALALAQQGSAAQRAAALTILDHLGTPAALPVVGEILRQAGDDAALQARALYALPDEPSDVPQEQAAPVLAEIQRLAAQARDPEVRRRALLALGEWGGPEVEPALREALSSADSQVRAAAAFALGRQRAREPATLRALARVLADPGEELAARENAFHALRGAGPLPADVYRALQDYLLEREGMGLGD
ncbi:MAG: hypothetical protein KatS3mg102_0401 [Planctomycetota bacterium]|nr:MAG: hypothetical protein KatS3mg102_0401 [Planctomycetota bacterium]